MSGSVVFDHMRMIDADVSGALLEVAGGVATRVHQMLDKVVRSRRYWRCSAAPVVLRRGRGSARAPGAALPCLPPRRPRIGAFHERFGSVRPHADDRR